MVYLENFQFPNEERRVYPYHLLNQKGLEHIEFAPITILYGNNGSGKSTILNMIAERLAIRDMTLGNTNEYFSSCVRKCTYTAERSRRTGYTVYPAGGWTDSDRRRRDHAG